MKNNRSAAALEATTPISSERGGPVVKVLRPRYATNAPLLLASTPKAGRQQALVLQSPSIPRSPLGTIGASRNMPLSSSSSSSILSVQSPSVPRSPLPITSYRGRTDSLTLQSPSVPRSPMQHNQRARAHSAADLIAMGCQSPSVPRSPLPADPYPSPRVGVAAVGMLPSSSPSSNKLRASSWARSSAFTFAVASSNGTSTSTSKEKDSFTYPCAASSPVSLSSSSRMSEGTSLAVEVVKFQLDDTSSSSSTSFGESSDGSPIRLSYSDACLPSIEESSSSMSTIIDDEVTERKRGGSVFTSKPSRLQRMLLDPLAFQAFLDHLTAEFSAEVPPSMLLLY
jgi:hypothetical protein